MQGRELEDEKRSFWIEDNVNLYHIKTTDKDYTCHTANHVIIKQILSVQVADRLYYTEADCVGERQENSFPPSFQ